MVETAELYGHCAKAFRRARLWDPPSWAEVDDAPDLGEIYACQFDGMDEREMRATVEAIYAEDLARDRSGRGARSGPPPRPIAARTRRAAIVVRPGETGGGEAAWPPETGGPTAVGSAPTEPRRQPASVEPVSSSDLRSLSTQAWPPPAPCSSCSPATRLATRGAPSSSWIRVNEHEPPPC